MFGRICNKHYKKGKPQCKKKEKFLGWQHLLCKKFVGNTNRLENIVFKK